MPRIKYCKGIFDQFSSTRRRKTNGESLSNSAKQYYLLCPTCIDNLGLLINERILKKSKFLPFFSSSPQLVRGRRAGSVLVSRHTHSCTKSHKQHKKRPAAKECQIGKSLIYSRQLRAFRFLTNSRKGDPLRGVTSPGLAIISFCFVMLFFLHQVIKNIFVNKLDGVGSVDNRPSTNQLQRFVKIYFFNVTLDTLHVRCDM